MLTAEYKEEVMESFKEDIREPFDNAVWRKDNLPDDDIKELSKKAMEYSGGL